MDVGGCLQKGLHSRASLATEELYAYMRISGRIEHKDWLTCECPDKSGYIVGGRFEPHNRNVDQGYRVLHGYIENLLRS